MKNTLRTGWVFAALVACAGCSQDRPSLTQIADEVISESTMQKILALDAKYDPQVAGLQYLNGLAGEDLGPIQTELGALGRYAKRLGIPIEAPIRLDPGRKAQALSIIQDAEARWLNKYGWLRLNPSDAENGYDNENPALFTSELVWMIWRMGLLTDELSQRWDARIRAGVAADQLQRGLYDRYPVALRGPNVRLFSLDEQLGLDLLDFSFGYRLGYAKDQFDYGMAHGFVFFNEAWSGVERFDRPLVDASGNPESRSHQLAAAQRFGSFVEVLRRSAAQTPGVAGDVLLCAGMLLTVPQSCDETSERMMAYLQGSLFRGQTDMLDGCILEFRYLTQEKFRTGNTCGGRPVTCDDAFCAMADIYFQNPEHPIRRLAHLAAF